MILMVVTVFWHIDAVAGWLNGTTLTKHFGINTVLADAIAKCPDILFHSTYYALAVSLISLVVTAILLYNYIVDKMECFDVLRISMIIMIISVWAFPFIHGVADLAATALQIRDTSNFDVFQLGIAGWPLIVVTAICSVVLWLNGRARVLKYSAF